MPPPWRATVLTLFPELFPGPLAASLAGEALTQGLWALEAVGIREFGLGRHRTVDDTPAGGGAGMVMRADVLGAAIDAASAGNPDVPRIYLSPAASLLTQAMARELAAGPACCCSPAASKASTSASSPRAACARSRSATMCWQAASWRQWC